MVSTVFVSLFGKYHCRFTECEKLFGIYWVKQLNIERVVLADVSDRLSDTLVDVLG